MYVSAPVTPASGEPGDDLAHTGHDAPIGLILGIAAELAMAGGALVRWMRHRATAGVRMRGDPPSIQLVPRSMSDFRQPGPST
ncbi:hypothetical protein GCM10010211_52250 [Streptomyces albospinus]|uniref:Uncharacterized protein n=2 Tax=Streptomyces albospinus TaxID=285515 RepID=A0ABQ2VCS9_9ACTN|nr:hypothetical protein GCM10010211_52250 [Streptomyces albospinus]